MAAIRGVVKLKKNRRGNAEKGMSLIEVLISGAVLTVGLLALMGLIMVAMMSNNRSRTDGTATMLAQQLVERIRYSETSNEPLTVTDCMGHEFTIGIDADPVSGGGRGSKVTNSVIDFTESNPPADYHMQYTVCDNPTVTDNGAQSVYDVRWNIGGFVSDPSISGAWDTYFVTVAVKPLQRTDARLFTLPVNMRVLVSGAHQ